MNVIPPGTTPLGYALLAVAAAWCLFGLGLALWAIVTVISDAVRHVRGRFW